MKKLLLAVVLTAAYSLTAYTQTCQNTTSTEKGMVEKKALYSWWGNITGRLLSNSIYGTALVEGDNYLYMGSGANFFEVELYSDGPQGYFPGAYWEHKSGDYAISSGAWWLDFDFYNGAGDAYYDFHYTDDSGSHTLSFHFMGTNATPPAGFNGSNQ